MNRRIALLLVGVIALSTFVQPRLFAADTQPDAELLAGAQNRIEKHRKADATIIVVDESGTAVPRARVVIEQTRHEFLFGCNYFLFGRVGDEKSEEAYRTQFRELFNFATLAFYWASYERQQGKPQHEYAREVATWCKIHGIATKGHPLAWNYADPPWLPDNVDQTRQLQMQRISDCVSRFAGLIDRWDVVNEATHFERDSFARQAPKMTTMWLETGRIEFVEQCFQAARAANRSATLLINDYRVDTAYAELLKRLTEEVGQRPFDVIGLQSHMHRNTWNNRKIWETCDRFAPFGVPLHFTELTVLSGVPDWERTKSARAWPSTPDGEKRQAEHVRRIYTMLFSHPSVTAITWWDFSDRRAWQNAPAGLVRKDMSPKPAYQTLKKLIKGRWWTRKTASTDAGGRLSFRGFLGDYRVTVKSESGIQTEISLTLKNNGPNSKRIVLPSAKSKKKNKNRKKRISSQD